MCPAIGNEERGTVGVEWRGAEKRTGGSTQKDRKNATAASVSAVVLLRDNDNARYASPPSVCLPLTGFSSRPVDVLSLLLALILATG